MNPAVHTEKSRLDELHALSILDTEPETEFDDITMLAATVCAAPIAFIALIDEGRQWFKSRIGLSVSETPRAIAFCDQTIRSVKPLVVADALLDDRFRDNPLVLNSPNIRFYAGVPLVTERGWAVGTISVVDTKPRQLSQEQLESMQRLATQVMVVLKMRNSLVQLQAAFHEKDLAEAALGAAHAALEERVRERGAELTALNSVLSRELQDKKAAEGALRESNERYRQLVELSPDAILVVKKANCTFANQAGLDLFGANNPETLSGVVRQLTEMGDAPKGGSLGNGSEEGSSDGSRTNPRVERQVQRVDGSTIDVEVATASFTDGSVPAKLLVVRDITESNRQRQQLEQHANFDALTHLANRHLLMDRAQQSLINARRNGAMMAVALIDLDNFKLINDTLGHAMGDRLLVQMATRLHECVRGNDTVARYGGDEFVLVLSDLPGEQATAAWIGRLCERVEEPFYIDGHEFFVTSSIGVSFFPRDADNMPALLKHADAAMYEAKAAGKNGFRIFRPSMNKRVHKRFSTEIKLRQAVDRDQFVVHYQPQVNLASGEIVGCEALVRWLEPGVGLHSPPEFIAVAEETGLIVQIGQTVLDKACCDLRALHAAGHALSMSVNLCPRQFATNTLLEMVRAALERSGASPGALILELTESALIQRPDRAQETMCALREMGVRLAIDDFGTGYSSLSYLQRFSLDQLKIDQSFIRHVTRNAGDAAITEAIIALAHKLQLKVVAEGVSDQAQLSYLRQHSCDEAQGYLYSRAVPFEQLQRFFSTYNPKNLHQAGPLSHK